MSQGQKLVAGGWRVGTEAHCRWPRPAAGVRGVAASPGGGCGARRGRAGLWALEARALAVGGG